MRRVDAVRQLLSRGVIRRTLAGIGIVLGAIGVLVVANVVAFELAGRPVGTTESERLKAVNDARTSVIQLLGAMGIAGGLILTSRNLRLSREANTYERLSTAVEQLGSVASQATRVAGAYNLGALIRESPREWSPISEILVAFVRDRATTGETPGADVVAALRVLGRPPWGRAATPVQHLDLSGVHLPGANLAELDFRCANFAGANLRDASLRDTDLRFADFLGADLAGANLSGADLRDASHAAGAFDSATIYGARGISEERVAESNSDDRSPASTPKAADRLHSNRRA